MQLNTSSRCHLKENLSFAFRIFFPFNNFTHKKEKLKKKSNSHRHHSAQSLEKDASARVLYPQGRAGTSATIPGAPGSHAHHMGSPCHYGKNLKLSWEVTLPATRFKWNLPKTQRVVTLNPPSGIFFVLILVCSCPYDKTSWDGGAKPRGSEVQVLGLCGSKMSLLPLKIWNWIEEEDCFPISFSFQYKLSLIHSFTFCGFSYLGSLAVQKHYLSWLDR